MTQLLWEMHGKVDHLIFERRSEQLDRRDTKTILGQRPRCCGPIGYRFASPLEEELLWVADAVVGAVFHARARDQPAYLDLIDPGKLMVRDI
jgi:hypothetical protein